VGLPFASLEFGVRIGQEPLRGFTADAAGNGPTSVPNSNYDSAGVLPGTPAVGADWAVFKVDRVVTGRTPIIVRYSGALDDAPERVAFGHPNGLLQKTAPGAFMRANTADGVHSQIDSDIFPNSGGPAMNLDTGVAEGLCTNAPDHHVDSTDANGNVCAALNVCNSATGCAGYILYTRTTFAAQQAHLPLHAALTMAAI
jgi:hypothetical protein